MQRISTEETQPMHPGNFIELEQNEELSLQGENNDCLDREKNEGQSRCILGLKKQYRNYFAAFIIMLLVLLAFEICIQYYLAQLRQQNYQHNLKVLKDYQRWEGKNKIVGELQKEPSTPLQFGRTQTPSNQEPQTEERYLNAEAESINTDNNQNVETSNILFDYFAEPQTTNLDQLPPPTLNNHFEFQSDINQDNMKFQSKISQFVFPDIKQIPQDQDMLEMSQSQRLSYRIEKEEYSQNWINYQNYTGITVDQVANAEQWLQFKYFPLFGANPLIDAEREYFDDRYGISQYEELPICVVVPSYNNAANNRHVNNMNSILMQEYSNYHIVFIDDASTDSTSDDIVQLLSSQTKLDPSKYLHIRNREQRRAMYNLRMAANTYCQPQDIFMIVDGDDELIGRQVFRLFNAMFQRSGAWFVYSNFLTVDAYVGFSRLIPKSVMKENSYRQYPFVTSHLRAFYTQLFRNIREQDLRDQNGEYLKAANDVAICIPILQQAQERVFYIPELSYYYNSQTGLNNHFLRLRQQKKNDFRLRRKQKYGRLDKLFN